MNSLALEFTHQDRFFETEILGSAIGKNVITLASPFPGTIAGEHVQVDRSLVLDTMLFSEIRNTPDGPTARAILNWSAQNQIPLDPSFALMEQRLRHGDPSAALAQYGKVLEKYGQEPVAPEALSKFENLLKASRPVIADNVDFLRAFLPLIKSIWNGRGDSRVKTARLAREIVERDLPRFAFAFFFACVAFRSRDRDSTMSEEERAKIASDMAILPKREDEIGRLWNVAFDMSIFAFCAEAILRPGYAGVVHLAKIGSQDVSFPVFCRNICCPEARAITRADGSLGVLAGWALRPGADFPEGLLLEAAAAVPKDISLNPSARKRRSASLERCARELTA